MPSLQTGSNMLLINTRCRWMATIFHLYAPLLPLKSISLHKYFWLFLTRLLFLWSTIRHKTHHGPFDRANTFFDFYAFTAYSHGPSKRAITSSDLYIFTAHFHGQFGRANTSFDLYAFIVHSRERASFFQAVRFFNVG